MEISKQSYLFAFWFILFCNACSTELDIEGSFEEQVIVYCLLDLSESDHYMRIQKSFLQDGVSPLELSLNPDLIYYQEGELKVYIEEWKNNSIQKVYSALRVNGDTMLIIKDPGDFAVSPNILYHFNAQLDSSALYKLFVIVQESNDTIFAETNLVQSFKLISPSQYTTVQNFSDTGDIFYRCNYAVNGKMYELNLEYYYVEKNILSGDSVIKKLDWQIYNSLVAENLSGSGSLGYQFPQSTFYIFVRNNIDQNPEVIRTFLYLNYTFYAGGIELFYSYMNSITTAGILENYDINFYSNISGGSGIFSSRYKVQVDSIVLNAASLDSLACGLSTNHLAFKSSLSNPYYPGCK